LRDEREGGCTREPSRFRERQLEADLSAFGFHDFSVAATEPSGLDRTKTGGSYTPS
jgi:hypothetical protein